jgi:photosystem II stability/assembly factor-like uncharacterized protein
VVLMAALLLTLVCALVVAIITSRSLVGAVPGKSPLLGLAATDDGFLVGTGRGAFVSRDGRNWSAVKALKRSRALVADGRNEGVVLAQEMVWLTRNLSTFSIRGRVGAAAALAVAPEGAVYVVRRDSRQVLRLSGDQTREVHFSRGPNEIVALAPLGQRSVLAGGLTSGLWESKDEGITWRRLLETPIRAIMADPANLDRLFIATAGGILTSDDGGRRWSFTDMRFPVEALAESGGSFFAVSGDRMVYTSTDGVRWARIDA